MPDEVDLLQKEENELTREKEIGRILSTFKLDSYAILDLKPGCSPEDIRKTFRKKSLLIHPDKTPNKRAPDAFDTLKKAHANLVDDSIREQLDSSYAEARRLLIRERKWNIDDARLNSSSFLVDWREKIKELLLEEELLKRLEKKRKMEEEGQVQQKKEEQLKETEGKRLQQQKWEDTRESRVQNWRSFVKKKRKKSKDVLA
ncbi:hypothetical protein PP7435_CHR2-1153 [Komagataella phaffii CBS 7435]|uniref:J domain-containing protein n=2 Tax=Komagataella phaffii TaxID=460519 RepID=C4QZT9_KOMPG|nr:Hypothetical protein PAS_chr2-1_0157 [Komagataella phaffii GS115]AOA62649.1 GQ67_00182T0 [Komagataella phaffii]CAH2448739.1 hypothetical protein BQ9382_C2-6185 [Komagataella phaffii CBS 7435]AOA67845.1 GQ68_01206T0 [Komagataella phaffii GS115]CAY68763.1 Hypothetical protein PAS_chr2-1_0157 [Komagataella phaffii GS115]CCA38830.1 hypothetical protein PP7435_CHR2-1153 [Komagataella phaffii CBS 7435]